MLFKPSKKKFGCYGSLVDIASEFQKNLVYNKYAFRNIPVCISPNYVICFRLTTSHIKPIALINNTGECRIVLHIGTEGSESDESDGDSVINYESDDDSNGNAAV